MYPPVPIRRGPQAVRIPPALHLAPFKRPNVDVLLSTSHTSSSQLAKMTTITTPLTKLFKIKHPIFLAGMNVAAGPGLAAAVTNAGGLGTHPLEQKLISGVIGGVG